RPRARARDPPASVHGDRGLVAARQVGGTAVRRLVRRGPRRLDDAREVATALGLDRADLGPLAALRLGPDLDRALREVRLRGTARQRAPSAARSVRAGG